MTHRSYLKLCDGDFLTSVDDTTGDTDDTETGTTKTDDAAFDGDTTSSTTASTTRSATNDTTECCTCDCTEDDGCLDHGDGLKDGSGSPALNHYQQDSVKSVNMVNPGKRTETEIASMMRPSWRGTLMGSKLIENSSFMIERRCAMSILSHSEYSNTSIELRNR